MVKASCPVGSTITSKVSATAMRNSSTVHRLHVLAVGGDDGHLQAGDAHVEVAHRRAVDEAQAHALAGRNRPVQFAGRRLAVHQVGVGGAVDVGEVGRAHAHRAPRRRARRASPRARASRTSRTKVADGALADVVVVATASSACANTRSRILVGPVGEHHHVVAIEAEGLGLERLDHQRRRTARAVPGSPSGCGTSRCRSAAP